MFSRITDFIKPAGVARDPHQQAQVPKDKRGNGGGDKPPSPPPEDATQFSIGAIRALLAEQVKADPGQAAAADEIVALLDALEHRGIHEIVVALNQSIRAAAEAALAGAGG